ALYLSSFIVAVARYMSSIVTLCRAAVPLGVALPAVRLANDLHHNITLQVAGHLFGLFVIATCAHSLLAEKRPPVRDLTEFYLLLSVGGALGGVFNALLAPVLFNGIWEYAIALVLAALAAWPGKAILDSHNWKDRLVPDAQDLFLAMAALAAVIAAKPALEYLGISNLTVIAAFRFGVPLIICVAAAPVQKRFLVVISLLMLFPHLGLMSSRKTLFTDRSFFGLLRVQYQPLESGHWVQLWHGSTVHGMQHSSEELRNEPATYFSRSSPLGRVLESDYALEISDVAIVGLGAGTMAAYGLPHWKMSYFEIDPAVVKIASDSQFFTYLRDSAARIEYVLGDARLKLAKRPDASYDVIIIDAFSSDAIPVHLITMEAVELYMRKLRPHGVLLAHLTNRYLTLLPLAASLTAELGLSGLGCIDSNISPEEALNGKYASRWAVISRDAAIIGQLQLPSYCKPLSDLPAVRPWTDGYSNIMSVLK
ncbi:MAG: fused MFS/spermidine synthase, partial [Deltaproteobacteria bacterium]|nr:fused MFS/spermidine synthase [Deltaproteobacteria bacterium]